MNTEQLRVGDAERDEVATALHEHFAQGRLTRDELDERLTATLSAKTVGDLRTVTLDLPGTAPAQPATGRPSGPWGRKWGAVHWGRSPFAAPGWGPARAGWGPPRGRPFGPILLVALVVAAFTGWWVVFPLLACVWFTVAFAGFRHVTRRRLPSSSRR
jgi:Domain of unknown function (DUF1707)